MRSPTRTGSGSSSCQSTQSTLTVDIPGLVGQSIFWSSLLWRSKYSTALAGMVLLGNLAHNAQVGRSNGTPSKRATNAMEVVALIWLLYRQSW